MAQIKTQYLGSLRVESEHLASGAKIITDAPTDNHGRGESFSPTDSVCMALASCMLTIMGISGKKLGIELGQITAQVTKVMKADPRIISKIKIDFSWPDCPLSQEHREHLKEKGLNCPVALSLHPDLKQEISFDF